METLNLGGERMTLQQAMYLVGEAMRAADSVWAAFRNRASVKRGEFQAALDARNPGAPLKLWRGMVDGWLADYRKEGSTERRYLAYLGFDCIQTEADFAVLGQ